MLQNMQALAFELWTEHSMNGAIIVNNKNIASKKEANSFSLFYMFGCGCRIWTTTLRLRALKAT